MKNKIIIFFLLFSLLCSAFVSCDSTSPAETTESANDAHIESENAEVTIEEIQTEEITTSASEPTQEEVKMTKTIRIGSYNIKHGADANLNLTTIANVIKSQNLDIVGVQEVDLRTKRANGIDQPRMLADAADNALSAVWSARCKTAEKAAIYYEVYRDIESSK